MSTDLSELASSANFEFAALQAARRYRAALMREFGPHLRGRVLEIGAGVGQMTGLLGKLPAVQSLVAIEPAAGFCRQLRAALPGQAVIQGTAESVRPGGQWHAIVSINVLEHIAPDDQELRRYQSLLAPAHGVLCLFVPARPEIYAALDRDFGHHRRYTRPGLRGQLERAGFEILRLDYFNILGYFAWWFSFCLLGRRRFDVGAVRFYDRFLFPAVYWGESRLGRPPIGQNLIVAARAA